MTRNTTKRQRQHDNAHTRVMPSIIEALNAKRRRRCDLPAAALADIAEIVAADPEHTRWTTHAVAKLLKSRHALKMHHNTIVARLHEDHGFR